MGAAQPCHETALPHHALLRLCFTDCRTGGFHSRCDAHLWGSDDLNPIIHATILHLLGIDHTKLTYRNNGTERRLTDVHGHVIKQLIS
jgi:hypothetical protein